MTGSNQTVFPRRNPGVVRQGENSDVSPFGAVAVAAKPSPCATVVGRVTLKVAAPSPSVVTLAWPR